MKMDNRYSFASLSRLVLALALALASSGPL